MSRGRMLGCATTLGVVIGGTMGYNCEKWKAAPAGSQCDTDSPVAECGVGGGYYLPLPTVAASSAPASAVVPAASRGVTRVSDIMKFGFPGLDNVKAFENFVVSYDRRNRTAHWVFEHLTREKVKPASGINRESSQFVEDAGIHHYFRATNADYKNSGFDRGHLAAAGNHRYAQHAMDETFTLSNISPQVGKGFNRDAWNTLEKYVRHLTKEYSNIYVCTGPLYLPRRHDDGKLYVTYEVIGKNHVSVPTHFFKVVIMETASSDLELLSFVMPNKALSENIDLKTYLVPVESIERAAGLLLSEGIPKNKLKKINGKNV